MMLLVQVNHWEMVDLPRARFIWASPRDISASIAQLDRATAF